MQLNETSIVQLEVESFICQGIPQGISTHPLVIIFAYNTSSR